MRNLCQTVLSKPNTGSQTSAAIPASQLVSASFHVIFGDTTVTGGTVKIQASNDPTAQGDTQTPVNWVDIPSASITPASGASGLITINVLTYRWLRVVFTVGTPGTTTIIVNINALSV